MAINAFGEVAGWTSVATGGSRAFRAPGHPQASFAMESILDELAYEAGVDLLSIRKVNLPAGVSTSMSGRSSRYPSSNKKIFP